jgi:hypothetical protein
VVSSWHCQDQDFFVLTSVHKALPPTDSDPKADANAIMVAMLSTVFQEWGKLSCALRRRT